MFFSLRSNCSYLVDCWVAAHLFFLTPHAFSLLSSCYSSRECPCSVYVYPLPTSPCSPCINTVPVSFPAPRTFTYYHSCMYEKTHRASMIRLYHNSCTIIHTEIPNCISATQPITVFNLVKFIPLLIMDGIMANISPSHRKGSDSHLIQSLVTLLTMASVR